MSLPAGINTLLKDITIDYLLITTRSINAVFPGKRNPEYLIVYTDDDTVKMTSPGNRGWMQHTGIVVRSVLTGMLLVFAGTIPRNILFAANLSYFPAFPWAVPLMAVYLFFFWRYCNGKGAPQSTAAERKYSMRAYPLKTRIWGWSLLAGIMGIVTLVIALHLLNRMVVLPQQQLPDMKHVPDSTVLTLLLAGAPVAGIVEEIAFRGYMQGPIEQRWGIIAAILITGTMFAVAHLDFTLILWPYYVAVAAIYGTVTYLTNSILPAIVLHTAGNLYSNLDLWLHGQAEWQAGTKPEQLIWQSGIDSSFLLLGGIFILSLLITIWLYRRLAVAVRRSFP
ncbi:MAG: type II CAAX endopeptidase family protein [Chitinophagaceae bacterium]